MESGSDLLPNDVTALDSIHILRVGIHGREQFGRIQTSNGLLRDLQDFPDQGRGRIHAFVPLPAVVRSRTAAKGDSTTFVVRRWRQCSFGN